MNVKRVSGEAGGVGKLEIMDSRGDRWQVDVVESRIKPGKIVVARTTFVNLEFDVEPGFDFMYFLEDAAREFLTGESVNGR